jgi:hypothetical protein
MLSLAKKINLQVEDGIYEKKRPAHATIKITPRLDVRRFRGA